MNDFFNIMTSSDKITAANVQINFEVFYVLQFSICCQLNK